MNYSNRTVISVGWLTENLDKWGPDNGVLLYNESRDIPVNCHIISTLDNNYKI